MDNIPKDPLTTLKMVWAYMLEKGRLTDGRWDHYSTEFDPPTPNPRREYPNHFYHIEELEQLRADMLAKIKSIGVDWDKTKPPEETQESEFQGTFCDLTQVPALLGTLVLKDGTEYMLGVGNSETRFGAYAKYLADFFANEKRMRELLGEDEARSVKFFGDV